jgi:predicted  nucleic acid-binding Zn-ribbon protein
MRILALLLGTLLASGCSKAANNKLDEIADRACACKDPECSVKVMEEYAAWRKEYEGAKGDQAQAEKSTVRIMSCLMKARGDKTMDKVMEKMQHAGEKVREAGERAGEAAQRAGEAVQQAGEKVEEAGGKAREAGEQATGKPDDK